MAVHEFKITITPDGKKAEMWPIHGGPIQESEKGKEGFVLKFRTGDTLRFTADWKKFSVIVEGTEHISPIERPKWKRQVAGPSEPIEDREGESELEIELKAEGVKPEEIDDGIAWNSEQCICEFKFKVQLYNLAPRPIFTQENDRERRERLMKEWRAKPPADPPVLSALWLP